MFLLIKVLFFLWGVGLLGAGAMVENPQLCAAAHKTWFGANMIQIGVWCIVGVLVIHSWQKAPAGSTFGQKIKFVFVNALAWIKAAITYVLKFFGNIPEPQ